MARPGAARGPGPAQPLAIPVGLNLTSIGVSSAWWLETARAAEASGFEAVWMWDHFISRGRPDDPLLECWTTLTAVAMVTERIRVGSFVANVMNRHPALLANIVGSLADLVPGRVELGLGIGGHPAEHAAYGMAFPPASERAQHLEESVAVLRALFGGGPADFEGRHYRLEGAYAFPRPQPAPRIVVAGERPGGTRLAARIGDAWTCFEDEYARLRPLFDAALAESGRTSEQPGVIVGLECRSVREPLAVLAEHWQEAGATELVIHDVRPNDVAHILELR
jgi:alkanesulfonate monooxygenase SsuD/methylene tetrahydromethanopterin reductase-like flavin-dependent oxidoreductase (luciferase family)